VPRAALAGVLLMIGYGMIDRTHGSPRTWGSLTFQL